MNLGAPQFTICPGSVCFSQPVSYECSVNTSSGAEGLRWEVLNANGESIGFTFFANTASQGSTGTILNQFNTTVTSSTQNPVISDLSFIPVLSINNYTVECIAASFGGSFTPVTRKCPILIPGILFVIIFNSLLAFIGVPTAPVNFSLYFTPDNLTFSWSSSSSSACFSHYSVNVTSIDYTISTNNTNLSLPIRPMNGTEYSISVVTVDTGGRYMNPQGIKRYIADGKCMIIVSILYVCVSINSS